MVVPCMHRAGSGRVRHRVDELRVVSAESANFLLVKSRFQTVALVFTCLLIRLSTTTGDGERRGRTVLPNKFRARPEYKSRVDIQATEAPASPSTAAIILQKLASLSHVPKEEESLQSARAGTPPPSSSAPALRRTNRPPQAESRCAHQFTGIAARAIHCAATASTVPGDQKALGGNKDTHVGQDKDHWNTLAAVSS